MTDSNFAIVCHTCPVGEAGVYIGWGAHKDDLAIAASKGSEAVDKLSKYFITDARWAWDRALEFAREHTDKGHKVVARNFATDEGKREFVTKKNDPSAKVTVAMGGR